MKRNVTSGNRAERMRPSCLPPLHRLAPAVAIVVSSMVALAFGFVRPAEAVPSFARKYELSCNVCHTREPRLNPFGQRFQENGYQLPGTEDGGTVGKAQYGTPRHPLALGRVGNYVSARLRADVQQVSFRQPTEATDEPDFVFPNIINVFIGGAVAKNISGFLETEYTPGEGGGHDTAVIFERTMLIFSNLGSRHQALNVKIGSFDPSSFFSFPTHRQQMNPIFPDAHTEDFPPEINRIPILPLAFSTKMFGLTTGPHHVEEDGFSILPFEPYLFNTPASTGAAVYGRPFGDRFLYQLGVVQEETADDEPVPRWDTYAMLRYDHVAGKNRAYQVSAFYYRAPDAARPALAPGGNLRFATQPVSWDRYGVAARFQYKSFDVYATGIWDEIDQPQWAGPPLSLSVWDTKAFGMSLEVDWLVSEKWLLAARYDFMAPGGLKRLPPMLQRGDPDVNQDAALLGVIGKYYPTPNIGLYARGHFNLESEVKLPRALGGAVHPARNLESVIALGVDMAF